MTSQDANSPVAPTARSALLWLALCFAWTPSLLRWFQSLADSVDERFYALAVVWLIAAWALSKGTRPLPRSGGVLLAVSMALQLTALVARVDGLAVSLLPLAILGMACWQGAPSLPVAALSLWCVPLPYSLLELGTPRLESLQAAAGAALLGLTGASTPEARGPLFTQPGGRLELGVFDAGYSMAMALGAAAWFGAAVRGKGLGTCAVWAAGAVLIALPLQTLAVGLAVVIFQGGDPQGADRVLLFAPWLLAGVLGTVLGWTGRAHRSSQPGSNPTEVS
jgi:hypothetical protein